MLFDLKLTYKFLFVLLFTVTLTNAVFADADDAGKGTVTGYVYNDKNKPVEDASVMLKGTNFGTTTNEQGKFHFKAPAGDYTLVISHVGAKSLEVTINVKASQIPQVPQVTISVTSAALQQVNISANKTNKFK